MSLVKLTKAQNELAARARHFVDTVLVPHEVAAERAGGALPADVVASITRQAVEAGLNGGRHAVAHGGQGWSLTDYVAVHEQLGRSTNGLWWWIPDAYNVLGAGDPDQVERYLRPALRGDAWISYAVAKRFSNEPEKFGTGHVEGLVDAGAANNSALGGAWVPALVFGIPGDSITAIVIGVLYMKNMNPGPTIMLHAPELLYAVFITFFVANVLMMPLGYLSYRFIESPFLRFRTPYIITDPRPQLAAAVEETEQRQLEATGSR